MEIQQTSPACSSVSVILQTMRSGWTSMWSRPMRSFMISSPMRLMPNGRVVRVIFPTPAQAAIVAAIPIRWTSRIWRTIRSIHCRVCLPFRKINTMDTSRLRIQKLRFRKATNYKRWSTASSVQRVVTLRFALIIYFQAGLKRNYGNARKRTINASIVRISI